MDMEEQHRQKGNSIQYWPKSEKEKMSEKLCEATLSCDTPFI